MKTPRNRPGFFRKNQGFQAFSGQIPDGRQGEAFLSRTTPENSPVPVLSSYRTSLLRKCTNAIPVKRDFTCKMDGKGYLLPHVLYHHGH